jgi:hypothetical protein
MPSRAEDPVGHSMIGLAAGMTDLLLLNELLFPPDEPERSNYTDPERSGLTDFAAKAGRVLDLYAREWEGKRLGKRDYVISADEKTSIQVRIRCHPTLACGPGRDGRVEDGYERGGALAYLAAWDVHQAKVFGR